jgi:hypothetical protein
MSEAVRRIGALPLEIHRPLIFVQQAELGPQFGRHYTCLRSHGAHLRREQENFETLASQQKSVVDE